MAFGLAGIFTALVTLVWFYNSSPKMPTLGELSKADEKPAFSDFFSGFKDQMAAVGESVEEVEKQVSTEIAPKDAVVEDWRNTLASSPVAATSSPLNSILASTSLSTTTKSDPEQVSPVVVEEKVEGTRSIRIVATKTSSSTVATSTFSH